MPVGLRAEKFNMVSNDHKLTQKCNSKPKRFEFANSLHLLREFGAKKYFTDHDAANTIYDFVDSVLVCKMHDCYYRILKIFEQHSILSKAMQTVTMDRLDENKPLQNALNIII